MSKLHLITCIVQRGKADLVVKTAMAVGAQGATMYYGRGTGVRERLGVLAQFIVPEKEIILIVTKEADTQRVFDAVVESGRIREKGHGFAYIQNVEQAVGLLEDFA